MARDTAQVREHKQYIRHLKRELKREKRVGLQVMLHHKICETQETIARIERQALDKKYNATTL